MRTGDLNASVQSRSRSESPTVRGTRYPKEAGDRKANPGPQLAQSDRGRQASNVLTPVPMLWASQAGKRARDQGTGGHVGCWETASSPPRAHPRRSGSPPISAAPRPGTGWPGQLPGFLVVVALALFRCAANSVDVSCEGEVPVAVSVSVVALAGPQSRPFSLSFLFLVGFVSLL